MISYLAVAGLLMGFAAILGGNSLEGGQLSSLLNAPAAVIVLGGTLGAVVFQTPAHVLRGALGRAGAVFAAAAPDFEARISQVVRWSRMARKDGLLGLENLLADEREPFTRKALELLVDGAEPHAIRRSLDIEVEALHRCDMEFARVFRSMGGYAPTVGILGAVLGLIHVMGNLGNPDELGAGIATAFVATIYGVGFANLLFLPLADRIISVGAGVMAVREMVVEGVVSIAEGDNPRSIELRLRGFKGVYT